MKFLEEEVEGRLPGLLYADDLVLCSKFEEDLMLMVRDFIEMFRKRGSKVNADKSKMMVLGGEEGLVCDVDGYDWRMCQSLNTCGVF